MKVKDLTLEQLAWFTESFGHTKNQELADCLGTAIPSVIRMARELGLWKDKAFMAAMQRNASELGARATHLMGGNAGKVNLLKAPHFKPGESNKDRMSEEAFADMYRRIGETRKETIRKERIRVKWGLEQKTNLRVVRAPMSKLRLRSYMRRCGYEIGRCSNTATITDRTRRSARIEIKAMKYGFRFNYV